MIIKSNRSINLTQKIVSLNLLGPHTHTHTRNVIRDENLQCWNLLKTSPDNCKRNNRKTFTKASWQTLQQNWKSLELLNIWYYAKSEEDTFIIDASVFVDISHFDELIKTLLGHGFIDQLKSQSQFVLWNNVSLNGLPRLLIVIDIYTLVMKPFLSRSNTRKAATKSRPASSSALLPPVVWSGGGRRAWIRLTHWKNSVSFIRVLPVIKLRAKKEKKQTGNKKEKVSSQFKI